MRKVERIFIVVMLVSVFIFFFKSCDYSDAKSNTPKTPAHKYEFRVATNEESESAAFMGSQICRMCGAVDYEYDMGKVYGQLITLFGEPKYLTKDMENLYEYDIVATDEEGNEVFLYAYNGPTGPAIGGDTDDEAAVAAAEDLANFIKSASPSDYELEAYYLDGPSKVNMEVKDGKVSVIEVRLSEEEFQEAVNEVYGDMAD